MSERWLDSEIPDELRGMLRSAELDEPSAAQLARLRSRLGVHWAQPSRALRRRRAQGRARSRSSFFRWASRSVSSA